MKKGFKGLAIIVLSIVACVAFILMLGETESGGTQALVSLSSLAILCICSYLLKRLGVFDEE